MNSIPAGCAICTELKPVFEIPFGFAVLAEDDQMMVILFSFGRRKGGRVCFA